MKKFVFASLAIGASLILSSCGSNNNENAPAETSETNTSTASTEVNVFAAASLTESMTEIANKFNETNPNIKINFNFDSSGTLKSQIEEGAPCDIFISAAVKQVYELGDKLDTDSITDLLENEVVLVRRKNSKTEVKEFSDLATDKATTIALGNADVPVGEYSEELLTNLGIWDQIQDKVTWGSNVKEVTSWIDEGAADVGIVYKTDANAAGLDVLDVAENLDRKVIYPMAIVKGSEADEDVKDFYAYLRTDVVGQIFEKYGFKVLD